MSFRIDRRRVEMSRLARKRLGMGDTLAFVEDGDFLREFTEDCGLADDDLEAIQCVITVTPTGGDVVPVSTSVRDVVYCKTDDEKTYTSMSVIRYVYLGPPASTVLLLTAYPGSESYHMTADGAREVDAYADRQFVYFSRKHTR